MAALFDLDVERDRRVEDAFAVITNHVQGLDPRSALKRIQGFQNRLGSLHAKATAELKEQTGSDRAAKRAMNDGKTSKSSINKAAKRGDAANLNPDLVDKAANNELSEEQLDVIADASERSNGAAAVDKDFIDEIASVDPDQGETIKDKYLAERADPNGTQSEHDRRRAMRRAFRYVAKKSGLDVISIESDGVAAKNIWDAIVKRADELYEADGGRDVPYHQHPRTQQQRLNDAAYELICDVTTTASGVKQKPRHADAPAKANRPKIFVGITLEHYLGLDPSAVATQIGPWGHRRLRTSRLPGTRRHHGCAV